MELPTGGLGKVSEIPDENSDIWKNDFSHRKPYFHSGIKKLTQAEVQIVSQLCG